MYNRTAEHSQAVAVRQTRTCFQPGQTFARWRKILPSHILSQHWWTSILCRSKPRFTDVAHQQKLLQKNTLRAQGCATQWTMQHTRVKVSFQQAKDALWTGQLCFFVQSDESRASASRPHQSWHTIFHQHLKQVISTLAYRHETVDGMMGWERSPNPFGSVPCRCQDFKHAADPPRWRLTHNWYFGTHSVHGSTRGGVSAFGAGWATLVFGHLTPVLSRLWKQWQQMTVPKHDRF